MRNLRLLALAAALAAPGCYAYLPSSPQEIAPGDGVRLRLSAEEAMRYQDLRLANPRLLEGTLVDRSGSELMVEASIGAGDASRGSRVLLQRVTVPLAGIVDVERKHLDRFKTGLVVGGGAAVFTAILVQRATGSGSEDPPGNEVPEARRVPLLRFAIPWGGR